MLNAMYRLEVGYLSVLFLLVFAYRGHKLRYLITLSILWANAYLTALFVRESSDPIQLLAIGHVAATLTLVGFSATNWGRFIGFCFCNMFVLASLVKLGVLSDVPHFSLNYWTLSFALAMAQLIAVTILLCMKWNHRWVTL